MVSVGLSGQSQPSLTHVPSKDGSLQENRMVRIGIQYSLMQDDHEILPELWDTRERGPREGLRGVKSSYPVPSCS